MSYLSPRQSDGGSGAMNNPSVFSATGVRILLAGARYGGVVVMAGSHRGQSDAAWSPLVCAATLHGPAVLRHRRSVITGLGCGAARSSGGHEPQIDSIVEVYDPYGSGPYGHGQLVHQLLS
jgi:hypothetical protein